MCVNVQVVFTGWQVAIILKISMLLARFLAGIGIGIGCAVSPHISWRWRPRPCGDSWRA
ncbi:unnamed protein product, partial [Heterosigma akashiwo]